MDMEYLRQVLSPRPAAKSKEVEKKAAKPCATFDSAEAVTNAVDYVKTDIAIKAAASLQQWVESDDLGEGETLADRLLALTVGIADANKDGELSDDESDVCSLALSAMYDYLVANGVPEEDAEALLNDWEPETAERVRDLLASNLPDGEEASDDAIDQFAFSEADQESVFDSALDAVYRKTFAVRNGKKVKINKRISGTVRLSAKQKVAIRKAQAKSHSASAQMMRLKSMRIRKRAGL